MLPQAQSSLSIEQNTSARSTDTIVVLHDACYGHRYSRPRTSRAALSTIVERPERIHASIVGISAAYVRLGERHADGAFAPHPKKDATAFPSIPFRICKTTRRMPLASPAVTNVHGAKWMEELKIMCNSAESKLAVNGKELSRPDIVRSPDAGAPQKFHEGDLYLCAESLEAMEGALGAVCEGVDAVFNGAASAQGPHRAFVAIRPPGHHCAASFPSGFCWVNNVHVGIQHAALEHGLTHAAMIDFDLHHGDGSQAITWDHNMRGTTLPKNAAPWKKTSIGYFSLHDINSYPCEAGDPEKVKNASLCIENAHGQNIWNVHLEEWKSEIEFWKLYETKYMVLLEKTRSFLRTQTQRIRSLTNGPKPKACIFFSAGFDASEWESSGMQRHKVNVPTEFYARIARDVVKLATEEDCAVDGRVISVLEGGYSNRALSSGVLSHISGLAGSDPSPVKKEDVQSGLNRSMLSNGTGNKETRSDNGPREYDASWWASHQLDLLDSVVHPPPTPAAEPKKLRDPTPPTYSSPTQSFQAKVVSSPFLRRSSSNMSNGVPSSPVRPPSPPPPEVDWATAANELSKLLIPTERQTYSCKPEDLSAEATRARRDRQSILMPSEPATTANATGPPTRMSLRERKAKTLRTTEEEEESDKVTKGIRRKTVAGGAIIAAEKVSSGVLISCLINNSKAVARSTTPKPEPSYAASTTSSRRLSVASIPGSIVSSSSATRPETASSVRPGSSLSSRGVSIPPPVIVKKTRQPSTAAKTTKAPRKPSIIGQAPALGSTAGTSARTASSSSNAQATPDVDSLTSGMKKVSITLTTQAQRDAKSAEKAAAVAAKPAAVKAARSSPKKASAPKRAPASKATASKIPPAGNASEITESPAAWPPAADSQQAAQPAATSTADAFGSAHVALTSDAQPAAVRQSAVEQLNASASTEAPFPSIAPSSYNTTISTPSRVPLPSSIPDTPRDAVSDTTMAPPRVPSPPPTTASSSGSNVFIPYQPEGPPPTVDVTKGPSLTWLEPNAATPAKFKNGIVAAAVSSAENSQSDSAPATPAQKRTLPVFTATGNIPFGVQGGEAKKKDDSIWEVPETPRGK